MVRLDGDRAGTEASHPTAARHVGCSTEGAFVLQDNRAVISRTEEQ